MAVEGPVTTRQNYNGIAFLPHIPLPGQLESWIFVRVHCSGRRAQTQSPGVKLWPREILQKVITDIKCSPRPFPNLAPPGSPLSSAKQLNCFQLHSSQHEGNKVDFSPKDMGALFVWGSWAGTGSNIYLSSSGGRTAAETSLESCKAHWSPWTGTPEGKSQASVCLFYFPQ